VPQVVTTGVRAVLLHSPWCRDASVAIMPIGCMGRSRDVISLLLCIAQTLGRGGHVVDMFDLKQVSAAKDIFLEQCS